MVIYRSSKSYETAITGNQKDGFVVTNTHTPEEETEPDKPGKPGNPGSSGGTGGSSDSSGNVQTGDNTPILPYVLAMMMSAFAIVGVGFRRRRTK